MSEPTAGLGSTGRARPPAAADYGDYLGLASLLAAAHPLTDVPEEQLFITTHQTLELWFAQALREIDQVVAAMVADELAPASRGMERLVEMVDLWTRHLDVLDTMPAASFAAFRSALGTASGAQSTQFRRLELRSGIETAPVRRSGATSVGTLPPADGEVSLRVAHLDLLARQGRTPATVFSAPDTKPESAQLAELLLRYDVVLNRWRHRHWHLVMHVLGGSPGTGGTSGLPHLRRAMDRWCFTELWSGRETVFAPATSWPPQVVSINGATPVDRATVGGKGYGLQRMSALGLPVPPAFVLTTEVCRSYRRAGRLTDATWQLVLDHVSMLERSTGGRFAGSPPLLLSVRSGAAVSMPGMMDTVLNVGSTPEAIAWFESHAYAPALTDALRRRSSGVLGTRDDERGPAAPDPLETVRRELREAVCRVLESWDGDRARAYRHANGIDDDLGTAVVVQAMVFGNRDARSGSGVYFTRDPVDGRPEPFGEWLAQAQGEDLVSGNWTPQPLEQLLVDHPRAYQELISTGRRMERDRSAVLEIEFTVESGTLHLLQAREATGTVDAAVHWAVDLVHDGVIDVEEALRRVSPTWVPRPVRTTSCGEGRVLASGTGVSEGLAWGVVTDDVEHAVSLAEDGRAVVLARPTTSPHDIHGFLASAAVITDRGGSTSHAAVVGREMGLPCVVGCGDGVSAGLVGRRVTVDAGRGLVYEGELVGDTGSAGRSPQVECFLRWRARDTASWAPSPTATADRPDHRGDDDDH